MGEDSGYLVKCETEVGVLQNASVPATEKIVEVLPSFGTNSFHIRVQAWFPTPVTQPAAKLNQQFSVSSLGIAVPKLQPAQSIDALEV